MSSKGRDKKKRSKPALFVKESKKRLRSESSPSSGRKRTSKDAGKKQEAPQEEVATPDLTTSQKKLNMWKSLPRPAKISETRAQSDVSEENSKAAPVRRSLCVSAA